MTDHEIRDLSDRLQIADVLIRYATALDNRDWALLGECFTPDGVTDYGELGGINQGLEAILAVVRSLEGFDTTQHLIGNITAELDGDRATSTCYLQAQHVIAGDDGGRFAIGGTYRDQLIRTEAGWRIAHRTLAVTWQDGDARILEVAAKRLATGDA